jgi:hypothetical protein
MIQKKVQKRRDAEFKKATVQTALDKAGAEATTKAEKQFFDTRKSQLTALEKRLDGKFSREEKEKGGLEDQLKEQEKALLNEIATGFVPDALPTVTTQAEFDALASGDKYTTSSGATATKP